MSLGACTCGQASKIPDERRCLREGEGEWAWTRRNLVCGRPGGTSHRNAVQVGDGRPDARSNCAARKYHGSPDRSVELFRRGSPSPRALPGGARSEGPNVLPSIPPLPFRPDSNGGAERALSFPAPLVERSGRGVSGRGYDVGKRSRPVQRFWTFASASKVRQRSMSRVRDASGRMRPVSMWNFSMSPSLMMGFLGSPLG